MSFRSDFIKYILFPVGLAILAYGLPAFAQGIVADPNAASSNRPTIDVAPNGVPLVDIAPPNASGLSHNSYSDFNVGTNGAILNNSNQEVGQSVLGGIVHGNRNLQNGTASIILNEVTSTNPSHLSGYLEVFGASAEVIVANPNGITCNGCGFINTPRATLTTGTAQLSANGELESFLVEGGTIEFGRLGANFSNIDLFDIVSRKVRIDGPIFAKHLRIRAGKNKVDYATGEATPQGEDEGGIAIDSTAFGGMYAGRISIIATEKGAGVNMRGDMAANAGELSISADGTIKVGRAYSSSRVKLSSKSSVEATNLSSLGNVSVHGRQNITLESVASEQAITVTSVEGLVKAGSLTAADNILLSSRQDMELGILVTGKNLDIASSSGAVFMQQSLAQGNISIVTQAGDITIGEMVSYNNININSARGLIISSLAIAGGTNSLSGQNVGVHTVFAGVDVNQTLASNGTVITWQNTADLIITATHGNLVAQNLFSSGNLILDAQQNLTASVVKSAHDISLTAHSANMVVQNIDVAGTLSLRSGQNMTFGNLRAGSRVRMDASGFVRAVSIENQAGTITIDAQGYLLVSDFVKSQNDITLTSHGSTVSVVQGVTTGNLTLSAFGNLTAGTLQSSKNIRITSGGALGGLVIAADGDITLNGQSIEVRESLSARDALLVVAHSGTARFNGIVSGISGVSITASGSIIAQSGDNTAPSQIVSGGDIALTSQNGLVQFDQVGGRQNIILNGRQGVTGVLLVSDVGTIIAVSQDGNLVFGSVKADKNLHFTGQSIAANEIAVTGADGSGELKLDAIGIVQVDAMAATGQIVVKGGHLVLGNVFAAGNRLTLDAIHGDARLGSVRSNGSFSLSATGDIVVSQSLATQGDIGITGGGLVSLQQVFSVADIGADTLVAEGDITVSANTDLTTSGTVFGQNIMLSGTTGSVTIDANVIATGILSVVAGTDINAAIVDPTADTAIRLQSGGAMTLTSGGQISFNVLSSNDTLSVSAGTVLSGQSLVATSAIDLNLTGGITIETLQSGGIIVARGGSLNLDSVFAQGNSLILEARSGNASLGSIRSNGSLDLDAFGNIVVRQSIATQGDIGITGGGLVSLQQVFSVADLGADTLVAQSDITVLAGADLTIGSNVFGKAVHLESTGASVSLNQVTAREALVILASNGSINAENLRSNTTITLSALRDIHFGTLTALNTVTITSTTGGITADNKAVSAGAMSLAARQNITLPQAIAGGHITISADGNITVNEGVSGGRLNFTASGLVRSETLIGLNGVSMTSNQSNINVDHILSNQDITLTAAGLVQGNQSNTILEALQDVKVNAGGDITVDQALAGRNIEIISSASNIVATELGAGNVITLTARNNITLQGQTVSGGGLLLTATNGTIRSQSDLITRGGIVMDARQGVQVSGDVIALGNILGNSTNGNIVAQNIRSGAAITLLANNLNISENLSATGSLGVETTGNIYVGHNIIAGGERLQLVAGGNIHYGLLSAWQDAFLQSGTSNISLASKTYVGHDLTVIAQAANLNLVPLQSSLRTGGNLNIRAASINMAGGTYAFGGIDFLVSGDVNLIGTKLYAARNQGGTGNIVIEAQSLTHNAATQITSEGSLQLTMPSFTNNMQLAAHEDLYLNVSGSLTNNNVIYGGRNAIILVSGTLVNSQGALIQAGQNLVIGGSISGSTLNNNTAVLNQSGNIEAGNNITIRTARFENNAGNNITFESSTTSGTVRFTPPNVADVDDFLARLDSGEIDVDTLNFTNSVYGSGIYSLATGPSLSQFGSQLWAQAEINGVHFAEDIAAVSGQAGVSPVWTQYIYGADLLCQVRNGSCDFYNDVYDWGGGGERRIFTGRTIPVGLGGNTLFDLYHNSSGAAIAIPKVRAISHASINYDWDDENPYGGRDTLTRHTYDLDPNHYYNNTDASVLVAYGSPPSWFSATRFNPNDYTASEIEYAHDFLVIGGGEFEWDDETGASSSLVLQHPTATYNPTITYTQTTQTISGNSQSGTVFSRGNIDIGGGSVRNDLSTIRAEGNVALSGSTLTNQGRTVGSTGTYTCHANSSCWIMNDAGNATHEIAVGATYTANTTTQVASIISAGGTVSAGFSGSITNTNEPVSGAASGITQTSISIGVGNVINPSALSPDSLNFTVAGSNTLNTLDALSSVVSTSQLAQSLSDGLSGANTTNNVSTSLETAPNLQTLSDVEINLSGNLAGTLEQGVANIVRNALAGQDVNVVNDLNIARPNISAGTTLSNVTLPSTAVNPTNTSRAPPGHNYLYESRSYYTNIDTFYGSAYYSERIGYDPNHQLNFLGDAELETRLVQQTILQNTGQGLLNDTYTNAADQMRDLIDNGIEAAGSMNLTPGVALSAAQVAALDDNIVWYVEQEHNGQQVLVPQVYLAGENGTHINQNGAVIAGDTVTLASSGGDIINNGGLQSQNNLTLVAQNGNISLETSSQLIRDTMGGSQLILGSSSALDVGGNLVIEANGGSIDIQSGTITAQSATLSADDINITSITLGIENSSIDLGSYDFANAIDNRGGTTRWGEEISHSVGATLDIAENLTIVSATDLTIAGATLESGGDMALAALAGDIDITAIQDRSYDRHSIWRGNTTTETILQQGSTLSATGSLTLSAAQDITITTSLLQAGDQSIPDIEGSESGQETAENSNEEAASSAGGNITLTAQSVNIQSSENFAMTDSVTSRRSIWGGGSTTHAHSENLSITGSLLNGTGNVSVVTSADISVLGSGIVSGGNTTLAAGYSVGANGELQQIEGSDANVTLQGAIDDSSAFSHTTGSSFFGLNNWSNGFDAFETRNVATTVDASGNVDVLATGDITVSGSSVYAGGDMFVSAGGDINILAEETEYYRNDYASFSGFGVFDLGSGNGGMNVGIGYMATNDVSTSSGTVQNGSNLDAYGDLTLDSDNDVTIEASTVYADGYVSIDAENNVNITAATQTANSYELHESLFIGGTISVTNNMFGAAQSVQGFANSVGNISSGYGAANAAFAGFRAYDAVMGAISSPVSASIGVGFSYSSSESQSTTNTAITSDIFGGEGVFITAYSGDISAFGANIGSDGTISLDAAQNLLLTSAISTSQNSSENSSFGGSIGFGIGAGGLSPTGSVNASFGESEGWTNTHTNTHIDGGDIYLSSGNDTTIAGGRISGDTITVEVGGDFDLHSLQDTGARSNSSFGLGLGFGGQSLGPDANLVDSVGAFNLGNNRPSSVSPSFGVGSGSTAWVTEQSGLFSTGDVSVTVGGNTDLLSSVIGSTEGNVTIDTGTLTFADLTDHDNYTDFAINATFNSALWTPPRAPSDQPDPNPVCASIGGCTSPNWTAQGHYAFDDRRQNTVTTIGVGSGSAGSSDNTPTGITRDGEAEEAQETETAEEGNQTVTITIRDEEAQQELEDSGQTANASEINSDLALAQVLTKDEHERVDFYLSDSSLQAALNAGKSVGQLMSGLMGLINETELDKAFKDGMNPADAIKQILACKNAQHGFNLFDYVFATAHAAGKGCYIKHKGKIIEIHDTKSCMTVLIEGLKKISWYNVPQVLEGFKDGVGQTLEDYKKLIENPSAIAKAMLGMVVDVYSNPEAFSKKLIAGLKDEFTGKYVAMMKELVKDKPNMAVVGKILGSMTTDIIIGAAAGGAGGAFLKELKRRTKGHRRRDKNNNCTGDNCTTPGSCFIAGTPVWTPQGSQAIETIKVGDIVLSRDEAGRMTRFSKVDKVFVRHARVLLLVLEDDKGKIEQIGTTRDHPFHVPGKGFVNAGDLAVGMKISTVENWKQPALHQISGSDDTSGFLRVKSLTLEGETATVYNFRVTGTHTYFVGKLQVWVHNNDACVGKNAEITIKDHYNHHNDMVDDVKAQLESQGYTVSSKEMSFGCSTDRTRCRPDITYKDKNGKMHIIEIKTGNADLSIRQSDIFPQIRRGDSIPRGQVARRFGLRPGIALKDQGYPNGIPIEIKVFPGAGH